METHCSSDGIFVIDISLSATLLLAVTPPGPNNNKNGQNTGPDKNQWVWTPDDWGTSNLSGPALYSMWKLQFDI